MTFSPVELWDVSLPLAGKSVLLRLPEGHNAIVFVRKGSIALGPSEAEQQQVGAQGVALLQREGTAIRLQAEQPDTQVIVLGGKPLDEPIAAQGPFVMNTQQEIAQANADFRSGKMGR